MDHKLIIVLDGFDDEEQARWYGQHLKTTHREHVASIYVVVEDK